MLQSKRLGLTTILDTWRFSFRRQSSRQKKKPSFRKHLAQEHIKDRTKSLGRFYGGKRHLGETDYGKQDRLSPRFSLQRKLSRTLKQNKKPSFRKHLAQEHRNIRMKSLCRLYWRKRRLGESDSSKQDRLSTRLKFNSVREPVSQANPPAGSRTQKWLSTVSFDGTVIPKHLSQAEFPAGKFTGHVSPSRLLRMRTDEDKRRVEAVLTTPISSLTAYISPEMMDMIKKSPFIKHGEDVVVFRSHGHQTRGQNRLECYRILSRFLRNVASEIVYREQRVAADEMMYRAEGAIDDPQ